jgi:endonuclease YncB( thermonuclease family)
MREARQLTCRYSNNAFYLAAGLMAALAGNPAIAQSLDLDGGTTTREPAPSLDLNVNPSAPVITAPPAPEENVKAGIVLRPLLQPEAPAQPPAEPRMLDHPAVIDTAKLQAGDSTVALFGIVGQDGEAAKALQAYIVDNGGQVTCQPQPNSEYICLLVDGTDVADVSLVNGAAQTRVDATDEYRTQETEAQNARRGIWANLPPPPIQLKHPTVRDTATLVVEGKIYRLQGVEGLGGQYARDLQGYIAAHDDALMCQPQGKPDHYICVLPDGTDVAKEALVNGAAKVSADSPDSYRLQQAEALDNKRGIWANITIAAAASARIYAAPSTTVVVPGDEADGVTYVGGAPSVVIDGAPVFLTYAGVLGWGYYDNWHHWHGAPPPFIAHMQRFHPGGVGLPGYQPAAMRPGFGGPPGGPVPPGGGPIRPGGPVPLGGLARPGGLGPPGIGFAHPGGFGGPGGGFIRPGSFAPVGGGGGFHPPPPGGHHR